MVVSLYNPNGYRLDATHLNYKFYVDTILLASGEVTDHYAFLPKDSTTVRIPVALNFNAVGRAQRVVTQAGGIVDYEVVGDVTAASIIGSSRTVIPFRSPGHFSQASRPRGIAAALTGV